MYDEGGLFECENRSMVSVLKPNDLTFSSFMKILAVIIPEAERRFVKYVS